MNSLKILLNFFLLSAYMEYMHNGENPNENWAHLS